MTKTEYYALLTAFLVLAMLEPKSEVPIIGLGITHAVAFLAHRCNRWGDYSIRQRQMEVVK